MEEVIKFGGGSSDSYVTPISLVALIITLLLISFVARKDMIVAVLWFGLLIPAVQQFYVAGVHVFLFRIVILVGLIRLKYSKESSPESVLFASKWNAIDTSFSLYVIIQSISFILRYQELGAFINQAGYIWDTLGGYFLMRLLIVDHEDIERALKCLSYIFSLIAVGMLIEQVYLINIFGQLGGHLVPEPRGTGFRSIGPFQHTLAAGTAGATAVPLFFYIWYRSKQWFALALGLIASTIMTITSHSSTPLFAYVAGIIALLAWPVRKRMRHIRLTAVFTIVMLHLVMKAPVWFLIARIDLTGSSSSYHRANLIDKFIKNFSDWWLIGTRQSYSWGWDLWDIQNLFVSAGLGGGIAGLICFIAIFVYGYSMVGNASKGEIDNKQERCLWAIGAALFSFMVAFIGVNLFDQLRLIWFTLLAIISASTISISNKKELSPDAD